jgi:DNA-3-methyladenine glycosylase II
MADDVSTQPLTDAAIANAVDDLCRAEKRFRLIVDNHGLPSLRRGEEGLGGLLMIVTEQFLSLAAAQAIWLRLEAHLSPLTAERVLAASDADLLSLGLSNAKVKSFKGIATAFAASPHLCEVLHLHPDEEARKALIALPGIGPWSADIYLLSSMLRPDVFPAGDLALQAAAHHLFRLRARPNAQRLDELSHRWRPWRAVAARLLWSHYRGLKQIPQAK